MQRHPVLIGNEGSGLAHLRQERSRGAQDSGHVVWEGQIAHDKQVGSSRIAAVHLGYRYEVT